VDVAQSLPKKIVRRVSCQLAPLQRQVYCEVLAKNFRAINAGAVGSAMDLYHQSCL
jgi:SNF2 family DNA or RNA helicase